MDYKFFMGCIALCSLGFVSPVHAVDVATQVGKITMTMGHYVPGCRMVKLRENASGLIKSFRIQVVEGGQDDISTVALSALIANRDVIVSYDPAVSTGCGVDPAIREILIF